MIYILIKQNIRKYYLFGEIEIKENEQSVSDRTGV